MTGLFTRRIHWPRVFRATLWVILVALLIFVIWYVIFIYLPAFQRRQEAFRLLQVEIEILKKHGLTELPASTTR